MRARSEFGTHGFAASTRTVAKLAGVQHPLVNYHFTNKEGLWRRCWPRQAERWTPNRQLAGLRGVDEVTKLRLVQELHCGRAIFICLSQEAARTNI